MSLGEAKFVTQITKAGEQNIYFITNTTIKTDIFIPLGGTILISTKNPSTVPLSRPADIPSNTPSIFPCEITSPRDYI